MIILQILLVIYSTDAIFLFFERDSYEFSVSESAPIHTRIGSIRATSSASLAVDYELHGDTNRTFSINRSTGDLILSHSLDYETISIYKLTIEARSSSSIAPCLSELIIHVLNTNDNSPEINLMFYPSVVLRANVLSYDLNSQSTPLGAIYIKDLDQSTSNLTLIINDTEHFQIQFVRQVKNGLVTESTYILSTRNNAQLIHQEDYYLSLNACDNDQPILWTNRSYEFHLQSTEQFCNLSVNGNNSIIDIQETVPNRTLILHARTNKYCPTRFFSIDDTENFYIDAQTGDLYTSARFNRQEQSVYSLTLHLNHQFKQELSIRILDEHQQKPFLTRKRFRIAREDFSSVDLLNSSVCRPQAKIYHSFQLLSNCTLIKLTIPAQGKYLFYIQLNGSNDYEDTVLLDLSSYPTERFFSAFLQSPWTLVVLISLGSFVIIMLFVCTAITIRKQKYNHLSHHKKKASSRSSSEETVHQKYDDVANLSKLKVHDDHELSPSSTNTAIYLVQRPSPALSSSSPGREDEGYSGSSDVSDNHLPVEATILAANQLFEKYRIHDFRTRQSLSPPYVLPQRLSASCISPDVSLV